MNSEPAVLEPSQEKRALAWTDSSIRFIALGSAIVILALVGIAGRLRVEHWILLPAFAALPFVGPRAARLWMTITPFVLVGVLYDLFALALPHRGAIHVSDLYGWERTLFGFGSQRQILPEVFATATHPALDLICGFAYATYLFEVFGVGIWLHVKARPVALKLALGFLALNVIGMAIWFTFPAAPPWYVAQYGLGPARLDALPSAAGAARFDALLGIHYFQNFYARNVNVFGAMPSLHVAYPTLVACLLRPFGRRAFVPAVLFAMLVAFSAVYLSHHYVLDVFAGALLAIAVHFGLSRVMSHA